VTQPLAPAVISAMQRAVQEMGSAETLRGYGPEQGYNFLIDAIIENDYKARGVDLEPGEVFISDGAKCDTGNIQEIFGLDNIVAVTDPVYPVYVDTNVMAGRTGKANDQGQYERIVYMPCTAENHFVPDLPAEPVDLIYLCFPNNPTGAVASKEILTKWVDFARTHKAIVLFDAAYEAFITEPDVPHSIYEIDGAKDVAIEFRSFSKTAGFTGVRCAFTIVPKQLKAYAGDGRAVEVHALWSRRHCTKFNGASYISQAGAAAVYTPDGKKQTRQIIDVYMKNAVLIRESLIKLGYEVYGGTNAPYIWMKTPKGVSSWDFFDRLHARRGFRPGRAGVLPADGFRPARRRHRSAEAIQERVRHRFFSFIWQHEHGNDRLYRIGQQPGRSAALYPPCPRTAWPVSTDRAVQSERPD